MPKPLKFCSKCGEELHPEEELQNGICACCRSELQHPGRDPRLQRALRVMYRVYRI